MVAIGAGFDSIVVTEEPNDYIYRFESVAVIYDAIIVTEMHNEVWFSLHSHYRFRCA